MSAGQILTSRTLFRCRFCGKAPISALRLLGVAFALGSIWLASCKAAPYAAQSTRPLVDEERQHKWVFQPQDEREVLSAYRELAAQHQAVKLPSSSRNVRWSDLNQAAAYACDDAEMAIVRRITHEWGVEFVLLTIEDYPARLLVARTHDDQVYKASASVGLFNDHPDRAAQLLEALEKQMRAFARKRKFAEE